MRDGRLFLAWMLVSAITIAALLFAADLPLLYSLGGTWAIVAFNCLLFKRIHERAAAAQELKLAPVVARRQYELRGTSQLLVEVPITGRGPAEISYWLMGRQSATYGLTARDADGREIHRVVLVGSGNVAPAKRPTLYPDEAGPAAVLVMAVAPDEEWSVTLVATIDAPTRPTIRDLMKLEARSRTELYVPLAPARRRAAAAA